MEDDDDCHDGDVLYTYPEESESFLDDRDFLPKEVKRAHARKLLYSHTGSKKVECDQTAGPSVKAPEEPESMLIKFLKSIPSGDSKEELGSQDFEGMFAAAPSFASERKTPCFELDQQQVLLLRKFWQCPKLNKLAAFSEESFKLLKVEEKFMPVTQVPTLDSFVKMVNEKQGPTTKDGYRHKMWQNFEYDLRRVHKGARVSFLADPLGQRILFSLGELFRTWLADSTLSQSKFEEANQLLLGAFESSNRSLEQAARIGGMIHQLRRRVILEDLQVPVKKRDAWLALGLSPEGIMCAEFRKQLEDVDKLSREYKASARQLGIATRGGFKRSGEHQSSGGPPMKRPFRDWQSQSGSEGQNYRGSFSFQRGRGRGRGRGTRQGAQSGQQAAAGRGRGRGSAGSQPPQFWRQRGKCTIPVMGHSFARGTSRRSITPFQRGLASNCFGRVGAGGYWKRLCARVFRTSPSVSRCKVHQGDKCAPVTNLPVGNCNVVAETSNTEGALCTKGTRFLQHNVSCAETKLNKTSTSDKFETAKSIPLEKVIQNGTSAGCYCNTKARVLGHFDRFGRCIFPCNHQTNPSQIPEICSSRAELSIQSASVWSDNSSSGVYQNSKRSGRVPAPAGDSDSDISRRLVVIPSVESQSTVGKRFCFENNNSLGFHSKFREVGTDSEPGNGIHWGPVSSQQRSSHSARGAISEVESGDSGNHGGSGNFSLSHFEHSRTDGVNVASGAFGKAVYETSTTLSATLLEAVQEGHSCNNSSEFTSETPFGLVAQQDKCAERGVIDSIGSPTHYHNRCIPPGLGGSLQSGDGTRDMVSSPKEAAYQSLGDGSSEDDAATLPYSDTREACVDSIGQYDSSDVYQQDGGHKVTKSVHSNMASVQGVGDSVMLDHCYSHSRNSEQGSQQFVETHNSANRVDPGSEGGEPFIQSVGATTDRPVCLRPQFPDSNFLFLATESMGVCNRRIHNRLVRSDSVCVSAYLPNSSSFETNRNAALCSHSNSSMLAEEAMVFQNSRATNRCSSTASGVRVVIYPTSDTNLSFQPGPVLPDSMEDFGQQRSTTGLSARAETLVEASLRQGTRQTYTAKYRRYANWCERRGLDPKSAPLHELVNFLAELEQEGLSYSTLCGYRSMLGHVHFPIAGMSVGSAPVLSRLLKGVFNTNPPKLKLCPGWDVEVVLNFLKKEPFVPLETCSLKFLTLKTCFLLAITSARRADDLSKLSIHPLSCQLLTDKAVLVPEALLKQDRPSHFMAPIEIRAFQEDENLCAVTMKMNDNENSFIVMNYIVQ